MSALPETWHWVVVRLPPGFSDLKRAHALRIVPKKFSTEKTLPDLSVDWRIIVTSAGYFERDRNDDAGRHTSRMGRYQSFRKGSPGLVPVLLLQREPARRSP